MHATKTRGCHLRGGLYSYKVELVQKVFCLPLESSQLEVSILD